MNTSHQTFLLEYYRTADKKQAYRKAYPKTKEHCITNSVNRLLARPDIAEALREQEQQKQAQRKAIEAEIAEQYRNEVIGYYEAQAILTKIIRGELTREKAVKQKDGWTTITVTPTISETLRALGIYLKNTSTQAPSGSPRGGEKDTHKTCPPPWGELEGASSFQRESEEAAPHPFGDIYPKEYPGPYYDPADPNTKEKIQNLRLNQSPPVIARNEAISPQQEQTQPTLVIARKNDEAIPQQQEQTQPTPVIARNEAISQQQGQTLNTRDCFATARNDVQQITTNNNQGRHSGRKEESPESLQTAQPTPVIAENEVIPQQQELTQSPSVIARKNDEAISQQQGQALNTRDCFAAARNDGNKNSNHEKQQITTNNNTVPPSGGGGGMSYAARQYAWRNKLAQLRKEGWETADELFSEVYNNYITNQHSGTYKWLKQFEKAVQSRNLPPEEREKIIQETGWEYHPEHSHVMRRRKQQR